MLKTSIKTPKLDSLIFGGATIGCLFKEVDEEQAKGALKEALDLGITYFDTAPFYGAGLSEKRIGKYVPKQVRGEKIRIRSLFKLLTEFSYSNPFLIVYHLLNLIYMI